MDGLTVRFPFYCLPLAALQAYPRNNKLLKIFIVATIFVCTRQCGEDKDDDDDEEQNNQNKTTTIYQKSYNNPIEYKSKMENIKSYATLCTQANREKPRFISYGCRLSHLNLVNSAAQPTTTTKNLIWAEKGRKKTTTKNLKEKETKTLWTTTHISHSNNNNNKNNEEKIEKKN